MMLVAGFSEAIDASCPIPALKYLPKVVLSNVTPRYRELIASDAASNCRTLEGREAESSHKGTVMTVAIKGITE